MTSNLNMMTPYITHSMVMMCLNSRNTDTSDSDTDTEENDRKTLLNKATGKVLRLNFPFSKTKTRFDGKSINKVWPSSSSPRIEFPWAKSHPRK